MGKIIFGFIGLAGVVLFIAGVVNRYCVGADCAPEVQGLSDFSVDVVGKIEDVNDGIFEILMTWADPEDGETQNFEYDVFPIEPRTVRVNNSTNQQSRVRLCPSTNCPITTLLLPQTLLSVDGESQTSPSINGSTTWYRIVGDIRGQAGYIHASQVVAHTATTTTTMTNASIAPTEQVITQAEPLVIDGSSIPLLLQDPFDNVAWWTDTTGWQRLDYGENGGILSMVDVEDAIEFREVFPFTNMAVEAQFQLMNSQVFIEVLSSQAGNYRAMLSSEDVIDLYRSDDLLQRVVLPAKTGSDWYTLRLATSDNLVTVFVDGYPVVVHRDAAPLPAGKIQLGGMSQIGGRIFVDNFVIYRQQ